jgi:hypothetical protein
MTDDTDKPTQELTTQQRAAIGKTAPNGVSGRLKTALDDMIENGTPWEQAAVKANLTVRAMRLALKRPVVLKYLRQERHVLLARMSPQNLHAGQAPRPGREQGRGGDGCPLAGSDGERGLRRCRIGHGRSAGGLPDRPER